RTSRRRSSARATSYPAFLGRSSSSSRRRRTSRRSRRPSPSPPSSSASSSAPELSGEERREHAAQEAERQRAVIRAQLRVPPEPQAHAAPLDRAAERGVRPDRHHQHVPQRRDEA